MRRRSANLTPSIYLKNNRAKFQRDTIWNDGAQEVRRPIQKKKKKNNNNNNNNEISSDMRSVPGLKNSHGHSFA